MTLPQVHYNLAKPALHGNNNDGKEDRQFMQEPCHQPPGGHHGASFMKNF